MNNLIIIQPEMVFRVENICVTESSAGPEERNAATNDNIILMDGETLSKIIFTFFSLSQFLGTVWFEHCAEVDFGTLLQEWFDGV